MQKPLLSLKEGKLMFGIPFKNNDLDGHSVLSCRWVTYGTCAKTFSLAKGQKFDLLMKHSSAGNVAVPPLKF